MNDSLKLALFALFSVALTSCANIAAEAVQWRGNVKYDPRTGQWFVEFTRPLPADAGLAK